MNAANNKFLIVKRGVRLNDRIESAIVELDKDFEAANLVAYVTSGERSSQDQLDTIRKYCARYEVDIEFPEIKTCGVLDKINFGEGKKLFTWQRAWSRLLNKGVIINPPLPAEVLFDYIRNGVNKKGTQIGHSPHYFGKAFDIGGGFDHDITNEVKVLQAAIDRGINGIKGYLPERKNNCLHVDIL